MAESMTRFPFQKRKQKDWISDETHESYYLKKKRLDFWNEQIHKKTWQRSEHTPSSVSQRLGPGTSLYLPSLLLLMPASPPCLAFFLCWSRSQNTYLRNSLKGNSNFKSGKKIQSVFPKIGWNARQGQGLTNKKHRMACGDIKSHLKFCRIDTLYR